MVRQGEKSGSQQTRRWRKTDSNSRSHREGKGYGEPLQASIAVSDLNLRLSCRRLRLATPRRAFRRSGTDGSNPVRSSGESRELPITSAARTAPAAARDEWARFGSSSASIPSVDRAAERSVPEQCNRARHQFQHFACCAGAGIPRHRYDAEGIAGLCNRPKPGPFEG
jgi:hypothetical protein